MDVNTVAFLIILAIILLLLLLPTKKKKLLFNPIFSQEMNTWINECINKICFEEDLCENCSNCIHCGTKRNVEIIKQKYDCEFILTRCKKFQANTYLKMQKRPEQQEHFRVIVWVNLFTESIREKQCMCINDCCNLNIKDRKKNCPMANELYDLCVQDNLATIVFSCPIWDTIQGPM